MTTAKEGMLDSLPFDAHIARIGTKLRNHPSQKSVLLHGKPSIIKAVFDKKRISIHSKDCL